MTEEANTAAPEADDLQAQIDADNQSPEGRLYLKGHFRRIDEYRAKITTPRNAPTDGQKFADALLDLCDFEGQSEDKKRMFSEIVTRCAYDAAGNINSTNAHHKHFNGFNGVFDYLAQQKEAIADKYQTAGKEGKDSIANLKAAIEHLQETDPQSEDLALKRQEWSLLQSSAYRKVLNYLSTYKKGVVQTPHPTEPLAESAIQAEIALHHAIEERPHLFAKIADGTGKFDDKQAGTLKKLLMDLLHKLDPVTKTLKIEDEITRSVEFSELAFNAIPHMMLGILDPAIHSGLRNTAPLTADELRKFSRMIDPCTWSPGDRDDKPYMTEARLAWGIERNRNLMSLEYAVKIAEMLTSGDIKPQLNANAAAATSGATDALKQALYRIVIGIAPDYLPGSTDEGTGDRFLRHYGEKGESSEQHKRKKATDYIRDIANIIRTTKPDETPLAKPFESSEEMIHTMEDIRKSVTHGVIFPPFHDNSSGPHPILSQMDVLVTQMHSFGNYALRSQIRENEEMHRKVMEQVAALPEITPLLGNAVSDRKQMAETMLELLSDPKHAETAKTIRQAVQAKIAADSAILQPLRAEIAALNEKDSLTEAEGKRFKTLEKELKAAAPLYETLKGMELATNNPEAIPQYLIAECPSAAAIIEALALLKLVEPLDAKKHVEIVPLVEYRAQVSKISELMLDVYKNKYFLEHQQSISSDSMDLQLEQAKLSKTEKPEYDRLTIADVKKTYGLKLNEGDDAVEIKHTKMVMFAGSDIMKSAGPAGAALTQHAIADLRETLLNQKDAAGKPLPVLLLDYVGLGGGVHRSQPVATMYETTQGRSMRQTSYNIAHKAVAIMSHFVKRMLGIDDKTHAPEDYQGPDATGKIPTDKGKRAILAQLNLGNVVGLPSNDNSWNGADGTGERCNAAINAYEELYKSPEFATMMSFSAEKFAKLTSFAARPTARDGDKKGKPDYPAIVNIPKFRAIGYGSALNISGSCASMYFGVSQFLHADAILCGDKASFEALKKLYVGVFEEKIEPDTRAQDLINRATFGIVMSNMDAAWHYLGIKREVGGDNVVRIKDLKEGWVAPVANLASKENEHVKKLLVKFQNEVVIPTHGVAEQYQEKLMEWLGKLTQDDKSDDKMKDKRTLAIHALAQIDEEHQKVSRVLLQLHSEARGKVAPTANLQTIQQQILDTLPTALRLQIEDSLKRINPARESLAQEFYNSWKQPDIDHHLRHSVEELRKDSKVFNPIYYRVGACNECFENVPRAMNRPWWGMRLETQKSAPTLAA